MSFYSEYWIHYDSILSENSDFILSERFDSILSENSDFILSERFDWIGWEDSDFILSEDSDWIGWEDYEWMHCRVLDYLLSLFECIFLNISLDTKGDILLGWYRFDWLFS